MLTEPPAPPADNPTPRWIAHRGAGRLAPENTLAAFEVGLAHGYTAFECDVKLTADGVPFLLHDATLERTTDASGPAGARTWAELAAVRASGEPLPRLADLAAFARAHGAWLNLELKPCPGDDARTGAVVAAALAGLGLDTAQVLLSSFVPAALAAAQAAAPQYPRALLIDAKAAPDWAATAEALGCRAIVAHHPLITGPDWVAAQAARGWRVLTYTVNDAARAAQLHGWGVAGVITDEVATLGPGAR